MQLCNTLEVEAPIGVVNPEAVISAFGSWPSFHDAEVHGVVLNRGSADERPSITLLLHACAGDSAWEEERDYVMVTMKCFDVSAPELRDLGPQNVLSSLDFEPVAEGLTQVTLGECYGLSGSLVCKQVLIESVVPWRPPTDEKP